MNRIQTPRGTVIKTANGQAELIWGSDFAPRWDARYERAQVFVDSEILRLCDPLIPMQSSMLKKSGTLGTIVGSGEVVWIAPYARYQYYGKLMVGPAPKTMTDVDLQYHSGEAQRGAFWFERMKAADGAAIIAGAKKIAGGGI